MGLNEIDIQSHVNAAQLRLSQSTITSWDDGHQSNENVDKAIWETVWLSTNIETISFEVIAVTLI